MPTVVLAVLALGLLLPFSVDAAAPARPAPAPAAAAEIGRGPAAAAVAALAGAPGDRDPLASVPADFAAVMGYTPVPARMVDGTVRLAKPTGACSAPGGGAPFGFEQACRVHDYGYDLLRYAHATGQSLTGEARRRLDAMFGHDLRARCRALGGGPARAACGLTAWLFGAGVRFNSWRQGDGYPARETLRGWLRSLVLATPAGRDRYVDLLRVLSILVVVLGHWTIAAVRRSPDGLSAGNLLSTTPWLWPATWVLQVVPVFFVVGGFANRVSWEALRRRGGGYVEYLSARMGRLLRPALGFVAAWLVLPPLLEVAGLPAGQVGLVGRLMGQPLWFLGVYLVVTALAPAMVRLHRRFRLWVPAALAAAAAAVDGLRFAGLGQVGYLNLLLVWALVQQVGFFYADGTLTRLSRRALAGLGAVGLAALVVLTGPGPYPASMVGLPGEESNMTPPTVCIVALTVWQLALVMLARRRVSAWLARRGPWTAVVAVGSMAMTLYLWHMTAMVAAYGLVAGVGGPLPDPGSGVWWATRPLWLVLPAMILGPLALALARLERPRRARARPAPAETRVGRLAAVLGMALAALGLLGFVASGFTPLLGGGGRLLVLHVGPLQNLLDLLAGAWLARAAAGGTPGRPLPWVLAAVAVGLAVAGP
jgi:fucose 4-O-acetylase-like acetyltransferase